ncbi:hypothetical protein JOQ06_028684 [Pogonophryne albipinna]|uniref:PiggyBac transposable element-derived protein domain-containing protein n=1 Tax=Pogonophryne albipinna TaxID=1090488 RepID=A0AAD6B9F8_9TELE|nr:hypothetical protein JOQ06_028684 [Pogonophryne albipinna]
MSARFLTAREVLGKVYANAAAQDSTDSSSEEGEEEEEKEEEDGQDGEDEPRGQGVRGEEDALEYVDEVQVYEDKDHEEVVSEEEDEEERVSGGQRGERKEQSGHRETRGRNPEPEAQSSGDVRGASHRAGAEEDEEEEEEEEEGHRGEHARAPSTGPRHRGHSPRSSERDFSLKERTADLVIFALPREPPRGRGRGGGLLLLRGPHRARDIESAFRLFVTPAIERVVLDMTNLEGSRRYGDAWAGMDETDLRAYTGLLILAGVYKSRGEAAASLWDAESGRAVFRATMPLKLFHLFSRMLSVLGQLLEYKLSELTG